ncbi:hypothetical protein Pcinc_007241 [Petrolisthes cinctipes]|uniref:Uncharacterized protein n=1 Tax=Petrolisthes cinctipes TaxID=88211 RepID=A0AAE1GBD9_PETCI|nr:hypothetical protein Pcinc_007241 [Petrolisthes cinctipes]
MPFSDPPKSNVVVLATTEVTKNAYAWITILLLIREQVTLRSHSGPTTTTTMKILLLLLSCLAALALASPQPQPQERDPKLFFPPGAIVQKILGVNPNQPLIEKVFPCGDYNTSTDPSTDPYIGSTTTTNTTMKVLLLLLSCLAALSLASPLPRPQERDPRLFFPDPLIQPLINKLFEVNPIIEALPGISKSYPCGANNDRTCIITVGANGRR